MKFKSHYLGVGRQSARGPFAGSPAQWSSGQKLEYLYADVSNSSTYGHSQLKTGHPVRSAIHKQLNGRLVLRWVTTWESLLLYVLNPPFARQHETNPPHQTRDSGSVSCRDLLAAVGFLEACLCQPLSVNTLFSFILAAMRIALPSS
jgi:hypothetical protein